MWEHYTKNPQALSEIKAPLFEEKVVDHIVGQAKVTERTVSRDELFKPQDDEDGAPKSGPALDFGGEDAGTEAPAEHASEG